MYPYLYDSMWERTPQLPQIIQPDTVNTTRINYDDIYLFNIAMTKLIYPDKNITWQPHAVILVPSDRWQYAACASSLIHFPINAPIMFTERYYLPPMILNEILRLAPTGEKVPAKVLLVGPISYGLDEQLKMAGLTTYRVTDSEDVYKACLDINQFRLNTLPPSSMEGNKDIMVMSGVDYSEGIPATYYAAHMGVPIIIVQSNIIPQYIQTFININHD